MVRGAKPGDGRAFMCLAALAALYAAMALFSYHIIHMRHVVPLGSDAPTERFSEARAVEHVRRLSALDRQEGMPGLEEAARYIRTHLDRLAALAEPDYRVEVEETLVNGSFNMIFLRHSISLAYRNHKNIIMRISSKNSNGNDPSVLVNGHFDSPLGSPGAGDCGSCVASMLEIARLIVDSAWIPPRPIIFLFNGAEELFLLGSHGFAKSHRWMETVGAFINIEASGTGGFDLVCQSGPGSWPSFVYAQSAIYPMANSGAQDVFGIIPGDTDYRIFAEDYGDIPGLDIIFVLGGYFYHTSYDTVERLVPGSIQARGDNLFSLIKAFASSPLLHNGTQRSRISVANETKGDRAVYFDYLSFFVILYSRKLSLVLHMLPAAIFLLSPLILLFPNITPRTFFAIFCDVMKGLLFHVFGIALAMIFPVAFAVFRLMFSSHAMIWFAHPYLAFLMFVPSSLLGLLLPLTLCGFIPVSQNAEFCKISKEELSYKAHFWGAFGFYGFITMAYTLAGMGGGFLACLISAGMLPALFFFNLTTKHYGEHSLRSLAGFMIPLLPCILYSVYFGGFLVQFLIEKMGMMGSLPPPYGFFVPDILVAATIGFVTSWCVGPLIPIVGRSVARPSVIQFLSHVTILSLALSSQFFPYSISAPKRVVLQHTFVTEGASKIVDSTYDFSVVDANSLAFLFKRAPEVARALDISPEFEIKRSNHSDSSSWVALFPVSFLFSGSLKFPAQGDDIFKHYPYFPLLSLRDRILDSTTGFQKIHLELYLGSLQEVWVSVLNITGPLSNWSFADSRLPAPEKVGGGPPSYICRLSGRSHDNWTFWLETNSSEPLRVDVAVLDQHLESNTRKLKSLFPSWADLISYSSFFSSYSF